MNNEEYMEMLMIFHTHFETIIIEWSNGLKVKCKSFTGITETDTEPGDEDYIGEYSAGVDEVQVLEQGKDNSVEIYDDAIEISLKCIPDRISLEDGSVLWQRGE